jgi:CBS domain-containing protein
MLVKEAMTPTVEWIGPETSLMQAAKIMRDSDIGALPVGDDDRLIGMVTDRDIACRGVAGDLDPANTPVRQVMTKQIVWCFDDLDVKSAASLMEEHGVRRLPVVNRNKRMVGILSLDDLARRVSHALSGEVMDKLLA